ncbi:MAG: hypothetical protein R3E79_16960 [Caldilineaceae bacterium]
MKNPCLRLPLGFVVICAGFLLPLLTSCVVPTQFEDVYTVITPATLQAGASIPLPQTELILTVTGKVGAANHEDTIVMDRATLEEAGLVEYTVSDPFEERPVRYRGVLMRDLLALWQVAADAQTVRLTAINDYKIDIPIAEFRQYPILFALQADGVYMQPDYRGPAMLVYPVNSYEFDLIAVQRNWIWQIKTIDIQ